MGRNWSLLQETTPQTFPPVQEICKELGYFNLFFKLDYDFGLFAILSTPKKSLRVR